MNKYAACTHLSTNITVAIENISSKPIVKFELSDPSTHDSTIGRNLILTSGLASAMEPHEIRSESISKTRSSAGQLTSFQITVRSVTFADGTTWSR